MQEAEQWQINGAILGRVQGVGFRQFVFGHARRLGLKGYVKNDRQDRQRVEIIAEGKRAALEELVRLLQQGPAGSRVNQVQVGWSCATGNYPTFEITY